MCELRTNFKVGLNTGEQKMQKLFEKFLHESVFSTLKKNAYEKILFETIKRATSFKDLVEKTRLMELKIYKSLSLTIDKSKRVLGHLSEDNYKDLVSENLYHYVKENKAEGDLVLLSTAKKIGLDSQTILKDSKRLQRFFYNSLDKIYGEENFKVQASLQILMLVFVLLAASVATLNLTPLIDVRKSQSDAHYTNELRRVTGHPSIRAYVFKSDSFNAYTRGTPRVFYSTKVREECSEREVMAVLLHEFGHFDSGNAAMISASLVGITTITMISMSLLLRRIFREKLKKSPQGYLTISILSSYIGMITGGVGTMLINKALSQPQEFLADSYAIKYGYGKEQLAVMSKFKKEAHEKFCDFAPSGISCDEFINKIYKNLSHPSPVRRLEFLEKVMKDKRTQRVMKVGSKIGALKWMRLIGKILIEYYKKKGMN